MIGLYNLEPKYTNIAIEKLRLFYGDEAEDYLPVNHYQYDLIYASSIFTFTDKSYVKEDMICGGTGFDLTTVLPLEIEVMKPKINMGFTTRGCPRCCQFCVVPKKEGNIKIVGDIYDFWDRNSREIIMLDNNILAVPHQFRKICRQIITEELKVDFNQGLDFRYAKEECLDLLHHLKCPIKRFAWDSYGDRRKVLHFLSELERHEIKNTRWYVLIGFNSTEKEDIERVTILREHGHDPFVMPYNKYDAYQRKFARWVNHKAIFKTVEWAEYK